VGVVITRLKNSSSRNTTASKTSIARAFTLSLKPLSSCEQTRVFEDGLYALACAIVRRQGRSADGGGDGDAEYPHRELDGADGRVAVGAKGNELEDAPVQLRRPVEVAVSGGFHQIDEQFGGDVREGAYGAVGPCEE